jgi:N-acetylglutamate synthase-like GNAT family acetyltransferase
MSMDMLTIRTASEKDREAVLRVHASSVRGICKSHYSEEEIKVWLEAARSKSAQPVPDSYIVLVAEKGHEVVGFAMLDMDKKEVASLYVHAEHGGQGIGSRLLNKLEDVAIEKGINSLHLRSTLNVVSFYEEAGYEAKEKIKFPLTEKVLLDCVYMEKELKRK